MLKIEPLLQENIMNSCKLEYQEGKSAPKNQKAQPRTSNKYTQV